MTGKPFRDTFKYPEGVKRGDRVVANAKHAIAFRNTPRGRKGTVVVGTSHPKCCRIVWDGCKGDQVVHRNFFDVLRDTDDGQASNRTKRSRTPRHARGGKTREGNRPAAAENERRPAG